MAHLEIKVLVCDGMCDFATIVSRNTLNPVFQKSSSHSQVNMVKQPFHHYTKTTPLPLHRCLSKNRVTVCVSCQRLVSQCCGSQCQHSYTSDRFFTKPLRGSSGARVHHTFGFHPEKLPGSQKGVANCVPEKSLGPFQKSRYDSYGFGPCNHKTYSSTNQIKSSFFKILPASFK